MSTHHRDLDTELIGKLARLLDDNNLTEIEYGLGDFRVRLTRQPAPIGVTTLTRSEAAPQQPATPVVVDLAGHPGAVKSPMVGTAYLSPQPGAPAFVKPGDTVMQGDTLLIIEAMKVMNQIRAPKGGRISQILVEDSGPVEFGQVLLLID